MTTAPRDLYVSVDVETAGPNPSTYSLLSIGACVALEPSQTFYVELQPTHDASTPEAMAVGGFDLDQLRTDGVEARAALQQFSDWLGDVTPPDARPVFVAFNAPFDWMFVADAFHQHLGHNPFGHKAIDIKALFMGATGASWGATSFAAMARHFGVEQQQLTHNALEDAVVQADLFRRVLAEMATRDG